MVSIGEHEGSTFYYAQYIKLINIILVLRQAGKKKKRMTYSGHPFYSLMWERYFIVTEMT